MKILVFYPKEFNVKTKFYRKLTNILKNVSEFSVCYLHDENNFIHDFFSEKFPNIILNKINNIVDENITHCIFFDDGEEFFEENQNYLREKNVQYRYIKIKITRVVNIEKETQYKGVKSTPSFEYIGRGSYWGNPYSMYDFSDDENSREEVIRKFKYDFDYDKFVKKDKNKVYELAGKRLGCFCKPYKCHGDILADFLNSWDDGE